MLFKKEILDKIKAGEVTQAFRNWKKSRVNSGSLIKTPIGLIKILSCNAIQVSAIKQNDILNAGFSSKENLFKSLGDLKSNTIFQIALEYHSEDPRLKLRERNHCSDKEFNSLIEKLKNLDKRSKIGVWTMKILKAISENPKVKASNLAIITGYDKEWLKINVRKLKNFGLTISHHPGYEISPFGRAFLNRIEDLKN